MSRDRLDRLLREWAARHGADEADVRGVADRIIAEARQPSLDDPANADLSPAKTLARTRALYAVLGAAATLVIGLVCLRAFRSDSGPDEPPPAGPEVTVSPGEIESNARLFAEMRRLFGDDLRWIAETGDQVQLGVQPAVGTPDSAKSLLWIRVLVVEHRSGRSSWRTLLTADVLTRNEEYVEAQPDPERENRLMVWGYVLSDGKVAVDSRIRLTAPTRISADISNVFTPGQPSEILSMETGEGEIRLLEMVTLLPAVEGRPWREI